MALGGTTETRPADGLPAIAELISKLGSRSLRSSYGSSRLLIVFGQFQRPFLSAVDTCLLVSTVLAKWVGL